MNWNKEKVKGFAVVTVKQFATQVSASPCSMHAEGMRTGRGAGMQI